MAADSWFCTRRRRQAERPRYESDRVDAPIRAMARAPSQDFLGPASLRPGGGSRGADPGVSLRPGGMSGAVRPSAPLARCVVSYTHPHHYYLHKQPTLTSHFPNLTLLWPLASECALQCAVMT